MIVTLLVRFNGPLEIEAWVGQVAYKLKLQEDTKNQLTLHVTTSKAVEESGEVVLISPQLSSKGVVVAEPEEVVATRIHRNSGQ